MDNQQQSVLVLDGDMVSALTIARSLFRQGIRVDIASQQQGVVAAYSRAVSSCHCYPDPLTQEDSFLAWLEQHLAAQYYDLVIPVTERTLVPISHNRARFADYTIAMAEQSGLEVVLDKARTVSLANELGIPVPASINVHTLEELAAVEPSLTYPVVIKPARSVGRSGHISTQVKVDYAFSGEQLLTNVRHALHFGPVILQEYVQGDGVGVEILASQGEVIYAFEHQRLHEVPLTGGGSTLRKSIALDPVLLDAARRLMAALHWQGVAMVEFKYDRSSGRYFLMEINGRFWGSLPLAAASGADFPAMLFNLLVNGQARFPQGYRQGIYCRRLTSDTHWYELALRRAAPPQLDVIPSGRQMLKDLLLVFSPRHRFDVQSLRDIKPGLMEFWQLLGSYLARFKGIVAERWFYRRQGRAWRSAELTSRLTAAKTVLFLCYGNINRSALAEVYGRQCGLEPRFTLYSAGLHPESGRAADPVMSRVAQAAGVSFQGFSSTVLTGDLVAQADIILAMDKSHYDCLAERYPEAISRTFLLGGADGTMGPTMAIPDPYGLPEQDYRRCFERVRRCVESLGRRVAGRVEFKEENIS
jgi:predicted ATP-grasp superfamily ATP-dependent carboligase/protein-tyrosine-phosphatase